MHPPDAGLMQPPRNPAPSTHHKKQGSTSTVNVAASTEVGSGSSSGSGATRRRGGSVSSISSSSSIAATVAAVAGGSVGPSPGPGPPPSGTAATPACAVTGTQSLMIWREIKKRLRTIKMNYLRYITKSIFSHFPFLKNIFIFLSK